MKILKLIDDNLEKALSAVILSAMCVVIFIQIIVRFMSPYTGWSLPWTEELGRYLFVWLIYISSAMAVKLRAHIKVDVLKVVVHKKGNFILDLISNAFFLLFAVIFTYYAWQAVYRLAVIRPQESPTMHMPMWIPYTAILLGCALMAIRLVQDTVKLIREYRMPEPEGKEDDE